LPLIFRLGEMHLRDRTVWVGCRFSLVKLGLSARHYSLL
jgi:hypothetical protein